MNITLLIIVGALGVIGCLLLLAVAWSMLRDGRARKPADKEAALPAAPARGNPLPRAANAAPEAGTEPAAEAGAYEMLRVMRDSLTGRLLVEIAGRRYTEASEIKEPAVLQGFQTTLRDLQLFAGLPATQGQPAAPSGAGPAVAAGTDVVVAAPVPEGGPLPLPSMNPIKQMQVLRQMAKNPPATPKSITEQIDEILQGRVAGTPHVLRGVHVRTGPDGNALFWVDGASYDAVDNVPDAEVRDLIRGAIAEWEQGR